MSYALELRGVTKRFGAVMALEGVDFAAEQGELHALVGENGAGKTTLMRVAYGAVQPDQGQVLVLGQEQRFHDSASAIRAGIGMVSQHYSVIGQLSCIDNLILGAEGGAIIDKRASQERAEELAAEMGFSFNWASPASELSPAGAQKLEILKLLWRDSRIMILDEPTAMLSPADSDALFQSLTQLAENGATIILVTHRLPEVIDFCDRVTVLRGGKLIDSLPVSDASSVGLAEKIVGHSVRKAERRPAQLGDEVLRLQGAVVRGSKGEEALSGIDLTVRAGEIVGVAGVDGSGQRELFRALIGLCSLDRGDGIVLGESLGSTSTAARIALGMRLIPEDRHAEAVLEGWSLIENGALGYQRRSELRSGVWVRDEAKAELAKRIVDRFRVRHGALSDALGSLSGGNQQRFVGARALEYAPKLILAFQPCRGLDIDSSQALHDGIREARDAGAGVLMVSFDLDELLEQCDRIVVLRLGKLYEPGSDEAMDRAAIGRLMVGAA